MRRSTFIKSILLFAAIAFVLSLCIYAVRYSTARQLNEWKSRMTARGEKFQLSDLQGLSTSNSAMPTDWLDLKSLPKTPSFIGRLPLMHLEEPGISRVCWDTNSYSRPFVFQWKKAIAEVDQYAAELAYIHKTVLNPPDDCGWPYTNYSTFPIRSFQPFQKSVQWLGMAAIIEMHRNQPKEAFSHWLAAIRLAQAYPEERYFVWQMIRVATVRNAVALTWELLQFDGWTEHDLVELQRQWQKINLSRAVERALELERAVVLSYFDRARHYDREATGVVSPANAPTAGDLYAPFWSFLLSRQDELLYLQRMQRVMNALRSGSTNRSAVAFREQLAAGREESGSFITQKLKRLSRPLAHGGMANYEKALGRWLEAETEQQMSIAAIALARFKIKTGQYPGQLSDLVPDQLREVPVDYMDGKALRYRPSPTGFLLYSVGRDGEDNGGDVTSTSSAKATSLWEGRDMVWPKRRQGADQQSAGSL